MTRNILLSTIALFLSSISLATADSPIAQGLAGASRSGIPTEAAFTNPAAAWLLDKSYSFFQYTKPSIVETKEGGRSLSSGVYDGENTNVKGAVAYTRSSRTRVGASGRYYEDKTEFRATAARPISGSVLGGINVRYVTNRTVGPEEKYVQGDAGIIFPLFTDMRGGITYENVVDKPGDRPATLGAGLRYNVGSDLRLLADGAQLMRGAFKGKREWSIAAEATVGTDFMLRAGRFQDAQSRYKGWSVGASWVGPRASIDYAMRTTKGAPHERDHIFAILVQL